MKYYCKAVSAFIFFTAFFQATQAQQRDIKKLVDSQSYIFNAQTAYPSTGGSRQLSYGYDLTITKDKIVAYLPYFGRAYTAPVDPSEGGIKFTSTSFDYTVTAGKKSGWDVAIKLKDVNTVQEFSLTIFDNGTASLSIIPLNKQAITFDGYIDAVKTKKSKAP
ncbi:MAG: DUF4251 domain-containing protein [Ferruginibacter sp.]